MKKVLVITFYNLNKKQKKSEKKNNNPEVHMNELYTDSKTVGICLLHQGEINDESMLSFGSSGENERERGSIELHRVRTVHRVRRYSRYTGHII